MSMKNIDRVRRELNMVIHRMETLQRLCAKSVLSRRHSRSRRVGTICERQLS